MKESANKQINSTQALKRADSIREERFSQMSKKMNEQWAKTSEQCGREF